MIETYQIRVTPAVAVSTEEIKRYVSSRYGIKLGDIAEVRVVRRSIDARQRQVMVNLSVMVSDDVIAAPRYERIAYRRVDGKRQAVVVGAGPAGLFAALRLIELGIKPIVLERGKDVESRRIDVANVSREGIVDPDSNYCFGEGGAGAYSDGKLYTRSKKRGDGERILRIFCQHGAKEDILIDAHPHIGSDKLPAIIKNIRSTIIECGGEVHFGAKVTNLVIDAGAVIGAVANGVTYSGPVILATGHSARDVYAMLADAGIELQAKGIAVGVRLEHPQRVIDEIQYHSKAGRGEFLPAAEYSFVAQVDGRGVYSFCMCPGGVVIPAASADGQLVVNGMSPSNRGTYWANSGMVVEVRTDDVDEAQYGDDALKMMRFQIEMEEEAFRQAGNSQKAGAQRMKDFVEGKESKLIPPSSYPAGVQPSRLDVWLPESVSSRLRKGFVKFGKMARGFLTNQAIVIGVETRTSSPVRIPRDAESLAHVGIKGLYPCGEGAGYAGGIVSSAVDGERCAEALAAALNTL